MAKVHPLKISSIPTTRTNEEHVALESGLTRQFIDSMKTLFNMLDDAGVGLVPLAEIERRWRDDAVPNLPGVLDSLRAVAPADGLLSFEIFVLGLRSALMRARQAKNKTLDTGINFKETPKLTGKVDNSEMVLSYNQNHGGFPETDSQFHSIPKRSSHKNFSNYVKANQSERCTADVSQLMQCKKKDHNTERYYSNDLQQSCQENKIYYRTETNAFKGGHRRSNSGPVCAKVLPTLWNNDFFQNVDTKVTKMGYATKFATHPIKKKSSAEDNLSKSAVKYNAGGNKADVFRDSQEGKVKSLPSSSIEYVRLVSSTALNSDQSCTDFNKESNLKLKSEKDNQETDTIESDDLQQNVANTLVINTEKSENLLPINLSGKFIGLTGTLQRTKNPTCATSQYGSLKRPVAPLPTSNCLASLATTSFSAYASTNGARHGICRLPTREDSNKQHHEHVEKSNVEPSGTPIVDAYGLSHEFKRKDTTLPRGNDRTNSGELARNTSLSPIEKSTQKYARSHSSPDYDINKIQPLDVSTENTDATILNKRKDNEGIAEKLRQLMMPPPSGRSISGKAAVFAKSNEAKASTTNTINFGNSASLGKRSGSKRRDHRRHTFANGIDYSMLKFIKQLEQEKDLLLQGMDTLERGRESFQRRLREVYERQRLVENVGIKATVAENGYNSGQDMDPLLNQERLDNLLTKVSEMGRLVTMISELGEKNVKENISRDAPPISVVVSALREQNHTLTTEKSRLTDKIIQLEREKSVLVQQVFQARAEAQQSEDGHVNTSIFL